MKRKPAERLLVGNDHCLQPHAPATGAGEGLAFLYRAYDLISDTPIADEIVDRGKVWRPGPWTGERRTVDSPTCGSVVRLF